LAELGFSTLHIGVLTANLPARRFYEAMGGREIGQRTFDEEGYLLPVTIYAWSDIIALGGGTS
jgi:RimJ/RimL family protein N-acetyltransferase